MPFLPWPLYRPLHHQVVPSVALGISAHWHVAVGLRVMVAAGRAGLSVYHQRHPSGYWCETAT